MVIFSYVNIVEFDHRNVILMDRDDIVIVSGLPRSGTSLMMKMLEAGGIDPLTDNLRKADPDNPKGYYEFERVKKLPLDKNWISQARGKAVKVLAELIKHLPGDEHYLIIFMMRDLDEIIESQKKMMVRRDEDPDSIGDAEMKDLLRKYLVSLKKLVNKNRNMEVLYISYNELMEDPEETAEELQEFLDLDLHREEVINCVDPALYRNRA